MEKELIITLGLDKSKANQASAAFHQAEKQRIDKLLTDVEVAEHAKTAVIQRENQRRVAAEVSWLEAAKGASAKRLTDVEVQQAAQTKRIEAENQKRIQDILKTYQVEEKEVAKLLSDVEVAEKAKTAIIDRTNKQRIDAAVRAATVEEQTLTKELTREQAIFQARDALVRKHNQQLVDSEIEALDGSKNRWEKTSESVGIATKALSSFALQMVGLNSAQAVLGTIVSNFREAKQSALDASKFVEQYREDLLELAALKGQLGGTTETMREDLMFRSKTLQTAAASRQFQEAALGVGESAIDKAGFQKLISQGDFQRLMELSGSFQAAEGGSAETHGRLAGMIPALMGRRVTGEQAFAKEQQLYNIFKPGGGTFSQMTGQFLEQAPLVTSGLFKDPAEMAALLSAFSVTNPGGAGTNVQQFTRGTVGALGRMRGANIEGLVEKQAQYLKRLGATDQMSPVKIGQLISQDFAAQEQLAASQGQQFNPFTYLQKHGYQNQEDIMSILAFHGLNKTGQFQQTFLPLAQQVPTVQEAMAPIAKAQQSQAFLNRRSDIAGQLSSIAAGAGQEETVNAIKRLAFNQLKAQGEVHGTYDELATSSRFSPSNILFGYKGKVDLEAQRMLENEAARVGVEVPRANLGGFGAAKSGTPAAPTYQGDEALYGLAGKVRAAGGNVQPGFDQLAAAADRQLQAAQTFERAADKIEKALGPKNAPMLGRPAVQGR